MYEDLVQSVTFSCCLEMVRREGSSLRSSVQVFALPAVMLYLQLSLFAIAMGLCAGILLAGLAAWGTSKDNNEPPVRAPTFLLSKAQQHRAEGASEIFCLASRHLTFPLCCKPQ